MHCLWGSHPEAKVCLALRLLSADYACKRTGVQKLRSTCLQMGSSEWALHEEKVQQEGIPGWQAQRRYHGWQHKGRCPAESGGS